MAAQVTVFLLGSAIQQSFKPQDTVKLSSYLCRIEFNIASSLYASDKWGELVPTKISSYKSIIPDSECCMDIWLATFYCVGYVRRVSEYLMNKPLPSVVHIIPQMNIHTYYTHTHSYYQ